jgi:hypothetical protein
MPESARVEDDDETAGEVAVSADGLRFTLKSVANCWLDESLDIGRMVRGTWAGVVDNVHTSKTREGRTLLVFDIRCDDVEIGPRERSG